MKSKTAILIGGTGLIGSHILQELQTQPDIDLIRVFTRRSLGKNQIKVEEHLIDFDRITDYTHLIKGDVLFSCLGTTLKTAGSNDAQYRIDVTYQDEFARIGAHNKVKAYYLVSAPKADKNSAFFYSRIKGELEHRVKNYDYKILRIFRPSILTGHRDEERKGEKWAAWIMNNIGRYLPYLSKYKPISGATVARAMVTDYMHHSSDPYKSYELDEIFKILEQ